MPVRIHHAPGMAAEFLKAMRSRKRTKKQLQEDIDMGHNSIEHWVNGLFACGILEREYDPNYYTSGTAPYRYWVSPVWGGECKHD